MLLVISMGHSIGSCSGGTYEKNCCETMAIRSSSISVSELLATVTQSELI